MKGKKSLGGFDNAASTTRASVEYLSHKGKKTASEGDDDTA